KDKRSAIQELENKFPYPLIVKPSDDGCSSAVKKIKSREELEAFAETIFREIDGFEPENARVLKLKPQEEFPKKQQFLVEVLITKGDARHFLEITGGLLTKSGENDQVIYEVFEPSEALATGEVLSLEEKF